jgi:PRTRC genetic system protein A
VKPFIEHIIANSNELPPMQSSVYEYILGGNGLFIRAQRPELQILIPVFHKKVYGLPTIKPYLKLIPGLVPKEIVTEMWRRSVMATDTNGKATETLFHLTSVDNQWQLIQPEQIASASSCQPSHDGAGSSYLTAAIECHSHNSMPAFFSATDDADEGGVRVYAVLGKIFSSRPEIAVRVGIYRNYLLIPAVWAFELPIFLNDVLGGTHENQTAQP